MVGIMYTFFIQIEIPGNNRTNINHRAKGKEAMKKRRKKWLLLPALLLILLAAAAGVLMWKEAKKTPVPNQIAAKAAALLLTDQAEIDGTDIGMWTSGDKETAWYTRYLCWLYANDVFDPQMVPLEQAGEPLTYKTFLHFLDQIGCRDLVSAPVEQMLTFMKVPEEVWWDTYDAILERMVERGEDSGVQRQRYTVMGTPACISGLEDWQAVTDQGMIWFEGLVMDPYLDCQIEGLVKDRQLICLTSLVSDQVTYPNVWITGSTGDRLEVFFYGYDRVFPGSGLPEDCNGVLADVTIRSHQVSQVDLKRESIQAKVLSSGDDYIELEGYGKVPVAEDFQAYKIYEKLELQDLSAVLIGYDNQQFVVADGVICGALTVKSLEASNIRVLIKSQDFASIWHENLTITSQDPFRVACGDWEQTFQAGERLELTPDHEWLDMGRLVITCDSYAGELQVTSFSRSQGNPSYKGRLEITAGEQGLLLVNDLLLEDYLCRVVPSEMPASYPMDALKAQAVCARSYAYRHILGNGYREYGAHVDDSTYYQVYNNIDEQKSTTQAVQETYGKAAFWQDQAIQAYYYSTGWGVSEDVEIWGTNQQENYGYLCVKELFRGGGQEGEPDYSSEEQFRTRFDDPSAVQANAAEGGQTGADYDSAYPWYRWKTSVTAETLAETLNQKLPEFLERYPEQIRMEGDRENAEKMFGDEVSAIEITRRLRGGSVDEVALIGDGVTVYAQGQLPIRNLLGSAGLIYEKNDGSESEMSSFPSTFFYVDTEEGGEGNRSFTFRGGGYGHGVGMSQNGAAAMAETGMSYEEILSFFFEGIGLEELY